MTDKTPNRPFVTTLAKDLVDKLKNDLLQQGFEFANPPYTLFAAKKKGLSVTLYTSLKLTVMGKEMASFIEYYLEPEILKEFSFTHPAALVDPTARIGVDEAGKGDFFGPLCVAGVFASGDMIQKLVHMGVRDSKTIGDPQIIRLCKQIKETCPFEIISIGPERYNSLYAQFKNLNSFLAWGHATVIEKLAVRCECTTVIIDKFANEHVVQNALKKKNLKVQLEQKVRAESDVVVAAASILARGAFVNAMDRLSEQYEMEIPKGASAKVLEAGKKLVAKYGKEILLKVSKAHFKTTDAIVG